MRAKEKENREVSRKSDARNAKSPLKRTDCTSNTQNRANRKSFVEKPGVGGKGSTRKELVGNENVPKDPNHSLPLKQKPNLRKCTLGRALRVQLTNENVDATTGARAKNEKNASPLSTCARNRLKKSFAGENVPKEKQSGKHAQSLQRTAKKPELTPRKVNLNVREIQNTSRRALLSLNAPPTPSFNFAPQLDAQLSFKMTDLAKEYDNLCREEHSKLQRLERIIGQRRRVESEFTELIKGKTSNK